MGSSPVAFTGYSALSEIIERNSKSPKFKGDDWVRITKYKNIFSKGYKKQKKHLLVILCQKLNLRHIKLNIQIEKK